MQILCEVLRLCEQAGRGATQTVAPDCEPGPTGEEVAGTTTPDCLPPGTRGKRLASSPEGYVPS